MSDNKAKFICEPPVTPEEWDWIVDASPQGTLFSESGYLAACGRDHSLFVIRQGRQIKAGLSVIHTEDGKGCELDDLVIHNGLIFVPDDTKKPVRARSERFELTEFTIDFLARHYDHIELALAPGVEDMRPFLWHNYHDPDLGRKFILDLRYTSYLDISSLKGCEEFFEKTECFRAMDTFRQRHIRQAHRMCAKVTKDGNTSLFIDYFRNLMARQGEPVLENKLARMEKLITTLLENDKAELYEVRNHLSEVVYMVFYGWDRKRAYYLFGAGHPEINEAYQGTFAHWGAFVDLANRIGICEVDMEGVNSPQRGWFKLGFGGDLRSYYQVYKDKQ